MSAQTDVVELGKQAWALPAARRVLPSDATRQEWLDARTTGIGGSDIAALVGLSEWSSRLGVFADKIGRPEDRDNAAMEWGRRLEDSIAEWFTDTTTIPTRRVGLIRSRDHDVAVASIDRLTDCLGVCPTRDGLLEIKTTSWRHEDDWADDQVPDAAELQTVWYLGVSGRSHAHVVVLIDGRTTVVRTVYPNPELFEIALRVAESFWADHVLPQVAPDPTAHRAVLPEVKRLYPDVESERAIANPADVLPVRDELLEVKAQIKELQGQESFLAARLRAVIGDAAELVAAGELVATLKTVNARRLDQKALAADQPELVAAYTKPAPYRALNLKKAK